MSIFHHLKISGATFIIRPHLHRDVTLTDNAAESCLKDQATVKTTLHCSSLIELHGQIPTYVLTWWCGELFCFVCLIRHKHIMMQKPFFLHRTEAFWIHAATLQTNKLALQLCPVPCVILRWVNGTDGRLITGEAETRNRKTSGEAFLIQADCQLSTRTEKKKRTFSVF